MRRCLTCDTSYDLSLPNCPKCGFGPALVEGYCAYAPDLAYGGGGFKSDFFEELARLEETNFWFRGRNDLILWAIDKYCSSFRSFLEIGCGTGYVLSGVSSKHPVAALHGSEIFVEGLNFAKQRIPNAELMQMDARHIPYREEFDVIGAFDVLEHIEGDTKVISEVKEALKPNGILLLTVPQHDWLWSVSDEFACHMRRYSAKEIHQKLVANGFSVLRSTSFVSFLLPAMFLSRFKNRKVYSRFDPKNEFCLPKAINALFYQTMRAEISLIRRGLNFAAGGSLLVIALKVKQRRK